MTNRGYVSGDVTETLRAESHMALPIVCFQLCGDRGNPSVSISDKAYCLPANPMSDRSQAICFEPGVAKREGGASRFVTDKCGTLRANMGDNQPAICYPVTSIKGNFIDRDTHQNGIGWNDGGVSYTLDATDRHAVCYKREEIDHERPE